MTVDCISHIQETIWNLKHRFRLIQTEIWSERGLMFPLTFPRWRDGEQYWKRAFHGSDVDDFAFWLDQFDSLWLWWGYPFVNRFSDFFVQKASWFFLFKIPPTSLCSGQSCHLQSTGRETPHHLQRYEYKYNNLVQCITYWILIMDRFDRRTDVQKLWDRWSVSVWEQ